MFDDSDTGYLSGSERRGLLTSTGPELADAVTDAVADVGARAARHQAFCAAGLFSGTTLAVVCLWAWLGAWPSSSTWAVARRPLEEVNLYSGAESSSPYSGGEQAPASFQPSKPRHRPEHAESVLPVDAKNVTDYMVIFEGKVHIRAKMDPEAEILGNKWKCEMFKAISRNGWVQLMDEPGFMMKEVPGAQLLKPIPLYYRIRNGRCQDLDAFPIHDTHTCELAAAAMKLPDMEATHVDSIPSPEGCYLKDKQLWFAPSSSCTKDHAMPGREIICSSYKDPVEDCLPITTTITTTTKVMFPSLFCWSVVRSKGYEAPLVRKQLAQGASIFACDEFTVLSNGDKVWLADDWYAVEIPIPPVKMGDMGQTGVTTNSWLNTEIFMVAWELIKADGRFEKHDWTIKADPDAVLFPWRVRDLVRPHTVERPSRIPPKPPYTDKLFFLNCNRSPPTPPGKPQLFGAVELFSKQAMLTYFYSTAKNHNDCKKELPWHGWGEDSYMQHCMLMLGASAIYEFGWVADDRCIAGDCWDPSHAAFHDFKDADKWFECWNQGIETQPPE